MRKNELHGVERNQLGLFYTGNYKRTKESGYQIECSHKNREE